MSNDCVKIEKIFFTPIENVWAAWTDPQIILKWFGSDPNGNGINATMNVIVDGTYEITFRDSNGTEHTCMGKYLSVDKFKKLSFTWEWKNEPGVVSTVFVSLKTIPGSCIMIFEHKDLGTASAHNYLQGWNATFKKLEQILI